MNEHNHNNFGLTVRDYVKIIFRYKFSLLRVTMILMGIFVVLLLLTTPQYEAQVKVLISAEKQMTSSYFKELRKTSEEISLTQSEIVKSLPILETTVETLKLDERPEDYEKEFASFLRRGMISVENSIKKFIGGIAENFALQDEPASSSSTYYKTIEELREKVTVEPIQDSNLIIIKVLDFDPTAAAQIANVISRSYVIFDLKQQMVELQQKYGDRHPVILQLRKNVTDMQDSLAMKSLSDIQAIGTASVKIVEQASVPLKPVGPPVLVLCILALMVSGFVSLASIFLREYYNMSFWSTDDLEGFLKTSCIGSLPYEKRGFRFKGASGNKKANKQQFLEQTAEQIYFSIKTDDKKILLFTAINADEGTTSSVIKLAKHFSDQMGLKTLVIDANLRFPGVHRQMNIEADQGWSNILKNETTLQKAVHQHGDNLSVLTAGSQELNPIGLLDSEKMAEKLNSFRKDFDVILIDAPHLSRYKDAVVLSSITDGVVLVVREGMTRRQIFSKFMDPILKAENRLLGVILNARTFPLPQWLYQKT